MIVPVILSLMAGVTENYLQGIVKSGVTLKWVFQVWELYSETIFLSLWIAVVCLLVDLLIGVPAA